MSAVPARPDQALGDAGWWLAGLRGADRTAAASIRARLPGARRGRGRRGRARVGGVHRLRRPRARGRPEARSARVRRGRVADEPRGPGQVPLPLLPAARPRPRPHRGCRARPGRLARCPHPRLAPARPLRDESCASSGTGRRRPIPRATGRGSASWVEQALARHRQLVPPPSSEVFARESRAFLTDLDLFLRFEAEERGRAVDGLRGLLRRGQRRGRAPGARRARHARPGRRAPLQAARPDRPHRPSA